jgi:nodulation protein E
MTANISPRVVISGMGMITALGHNVADTWQGLCAGRTGIAPITNMECQRFGVKLAAQITGFEAEAHFSPRQLATMDRVSHLAVFAARQALQDARIEMHEALAQETQCLCGAGISGIHSLDESYHMFVGEQRMRLPPLTVPKIMPNGPASHISMDLGLKGETYVLASACSSGAHAIGNAYRAVKNGEAQLAFAGGAEACIAMGHLAGWRALRVLSDDNCRPFSKNRSGLVLGEGAAFLAIETLDSAKARGAPIYAEIMGYAANADAADIMSPDFASVVRVMEKALASAKLHPRDIGYINAHGTGTAMNDKNEADAFKHIWGEGNVPPVSSIKGATGHCLGASGAIEVAATALALHHQTLPPNANYAQVDEALGLDIIAGAPRTTHVEHALTCSFAFGGLNAALVLRRYTDADK